MLSFRDLAALAATLAFKTAATAFEITSYAQPADGSVNSWIHVGEDDVVLIGIQRSLSASREVAEVVRTTGRSLRAILLTHPHPGHFGGLAGVLKAVAGTPV